MLFTSLPSRPASGLRLEIVPNFDKKKSEFYFSSALKKILTEKRNEAVEKSKPDCHVEKLTEMRRSCTFREQISFDRIEN